MQQVILLELGVVFYQPAFLGTRRFYQVAEFVRDDRFDDVTREEIQHLVYENDILIQKDIPQLNRRFAAAPVEPSYSYVVDFNAVKIPDIQEYFPQVEYLIASGTSRLDLAP